MTMQAILNATAAGLALLSFSTCYAGGEMDIHRHVVHFRRQRQVCP